MFINDSNYFQGVSQDGLIDFVVTFNPVKNEYIADVFEANIKKNNDAYIDTISFTTLAEAIEDLTTYQLNIR